MNSIKKSPAVKTDLIMDDDVNNIILNFSRTSQYPKQHFQKVLIADRQLIVAKDLKQFLERLGYNILPVVNNEDRLFYMALNNKPGLIITDTQLNRKSGGIDAIMKLSGLINTHYIFLTTNSDYDFPFYSEQLNSYAVIKKPIEYGKLLFHINKALFPTFENVE